MDFDHWAVFGWNLLIWSDKLRFTDLCILWLFMLRNGDIHIQVMELTRYYVNLVATKEVLNNHLASFFLFLLPVTAMKTGRLEM